MIINGLKEAVGLPVDGSLPDTFRDPQLAMAVALTFTPSGRNVYAGTVPHAEVERRRARNRAARRARRVNRGRR